jgi:transcriptional regulator with XRE-family HTH domain
MVYTFFEVIDMELSRTLAALRRDRSLSQAAVAKFLTARGCGLTQRAISKWERGDTVPNAEQFLLLCELYGVRDVLWTFCGLPEAAEALNERGRQRLSEYARLLTASGEFSEGARRERAAVRRRIPLYALPVSAGTGQFLDSGDYELLEADGTAPLSANYAVRISGDSMAPRYLDGQIVYVQQQQTLRRGEIGIFLLNGDAYCKRLAGDGAAVLESLNTRYPPVPVREFDEFRVLGKVVE